MILSNLLQHHNDFMICGDKISPSILATFLPYWSNNFIYTDIALVDKIKLDSDKLYFIHRDDNNPSMIYMHSEPLDLLPRW
ncbi:MAG: hypothetical protein R3321_00110 [Nitrososphaeraceae archaeon]|nr:hypothetical protein [Nitrososphaeraceae archaeon]